MRTFHPDRASTSPLGLLVGIGVFIMVLGSTIHVTSVLMQDAEEQQQAGEDDADMLLDILVGNAGGPSAWARSATGDPGQLGMAFEHRPYVLDPAKFARVRNVSDITPAEVREALGAPDGARLGLRAHPTTPADMSEGLRSLRNLQVSYAGTKSLVAAVEAQDLAALSDFSSAYPKVTTFTGTDGDADRFDTATYRHRLALNLRLWGFETAELPATPDGTHWKVVQWTPDGPGTAVGDDDATRVLTLSEWNAGASEWTYYPARSNYRIVLPFFDFQNVSDDASIEVEVTHWMQGNEEINAITGATLAQDYGEVAVWNCGPDDDCSGGGWSTTRLANQTGTFDPDAFETASVNVTEVAHGNKTWIALNWNRDVIYPPGSLNVDAHPGWFIKEIRVVANESGRKTELYRNAFDGTARHVGDVLVVGTGVDHALLDDVRTRDAIQTNVRNGMGLLTLGSDVASADWLAPHLLDPAASAEAAGDGRVESPDPHHPLLRFPYDLTGRIGERVPEDGLTTLPITAEYAPALTAATPSGETAVLLAGTHPGLVGDHATVLTAYEPGRWTSPEDRQEFLTNALAYVKYFELILQSGDVAPPGGIPVVTVDRVVTVEHPVLGPTRTKVALTYSLH